MSKKSPQLRFEGFTDDWEERKVDECFNFPVSTNSLSRALLNYDEGDIKSVHYGDILIKYPTILNIKNDKIPYITGGKLEKYKSSLLENGDLIFADAAEDETVGKAVEVNGLTEENLVAGLHTIVARSKDKKAEFFLGYYINSNTYHRQLLRLIQGSKVSSISKGNLQKTLVSFPKDFEEQQKIGSFFKQLDDTIALHQRKLDLLKEQKKGYLQKMFPKNGEKVPELRFAGFADDWEERKLGQYTKLITKGTTPKDKTGIGDVNFVKVENITNGKIYPINKIKQNEHDNYLKRSRLEEKDILFSIAGTLGRTAIVNKSILPANTNQALAIIRGYDFDTNFLITSLAGNVVKEYIRRNPTVGAQPNLSLEQVGNLLVNTPNAEEQQKIGSFFKQLDETIALHQRKLDLLKEQKKGFLQKMFV
ncbi:restriction endonuclease subunit S [Lactococcus lactis]|nr:restriction endonuclease subunit S [Lactococcus lactis]MUV47984.1 restriction endonuclease subunit S [Lactococcus lactis]QNT21716.1 restriction endonuclease subunit S [Lactococcus lactis subsp. lactis bv. diacetylactis]RKO29312.1 restriction endonuclease subunit S [Lactococcus lactis subsp. lactis bv. diacetylactis]RKO29332.1 restriction endonuclease subunit S [Lactococcus lactis subsp. lactis bv. diacetylactis]